MDKFVYKFPEVEIRRYNVHGIAHARIKKMMPVPLSGCYIDLEEILKISPPNYAWMKLASDAPHVIISSGKQGSIPESVFIIKRHKNLVSLELRLWHNSDQDYSNVELIPVYKNRRV